MAYEYFYIQCDTCDRRNAHVKVKGKYVCMICQQENKKVEHGI